jgi:hypothetical protein
MLFAQQHGNEPSGKEALLMLIHEIYKKKPKRIHPDIQLILIPMVNPDGNEAHHRRNAADVDLNRNHLLLTEPETRLLHHLFQLYSPEVTLDIHEYGIRTWLESGYIKALGEQLDCLSNLSIPVKIKSFALEHILEPSITSTRSQGVPANRYLITRSDMNHFVRHSTTDINDGRNSFGIQYTLSFILEGQNGLSKHDRIWERSKHQLTLIDNFLFTCHHHSQIIKELITEARIFYTSHPPDSVIIQADYLLSSSRELSIPLRRTFDLRDTIVVLSDYRPFPSCVRKVKRPEAYFVEKPSQSFIEILKQHKIEYEEMSGNKSYWIEQFQITGSDTLFFESRKTPIPAGFYRQIRKEFCKGDLIVKTQNIHAVKIVQMLEPQSFYGLSHYPSYQFLINTEIYPIYRLPRE